MNVLEIALYVIIGISAGQLALYIYDKSKRDR